MSRYRLSSSSRRRRRPRKWVYIISLLLIAVAVKIFIRGHIPVSTFGNEDEFNPAVSGSQTEDIAAVSAPKPIPEPKLCEIPESASESDSELAAFIDDVMTCINAQPPRIIEARDRLNEMLSMSMSSQQLAFIKKQLSKLSEEWLFSRNIFPGDKLCSHYKVEPGDQFGAIGRKFRI